MLEMVRKMKACEPDHYTGLVRMHLSFMLDLATADTDCDVSAIWDTKQETKDSVDSRIKKAFTTPMSISKKKVKGVSGGKQPGTPCGCWLRQSSSMSGTMKTIEP